MARPPVIPVEDKFRIVLAVVSVEMSIVEAARRGKASERSISRWKQIFDSRRAARTFEEEPYARRVLARLDRELRRRIEVA